ncbi:MAG: urease accessory protein UreE [Candidatus Binataceae bacterium]
MPRATRVLAAASRQDLPVVDTVILDFAGRSAQKVTVTGVKGTVIDIDLREPARLRTDDVLVLDDGGLVELVAAAEPLIEARAADVAALSRLAWHLGDRHVAVQVLPNRIRARRNPAIEALLKSLGAKVALIEAPFEPEGGAYEASHAHAHDHAHDHGHHHGHDHGDHRDH